LNYNRFKGSFLLRVISGKRSCRHFANTFAKDGAVKSSCGTMTAYTPSKPTARLSLNYNNVVHIMAARLMS
jgi:hypothetical protein